MTNISTTHAPDAAISGVRSAAEIVASGASAVLLIETPDGSANRLMDAIPEGIDIVARVVCASACRATVGGVADDLGLDSFAGGAIVLEDAQWADPTSLGRLQRIIHAGAHPTLLILVHRPVEGVDRWGLDQIATTADHHASLTVLSLEGAETPAAPELDSKATELLIAVDLVTTPIDIRTASAILGLDDEAVLDLGDRLVAGGLVGQSRAGFVPVAGRPDLGAGELRVGHVAGRLAEIMAGSGADTAIVGNLWRAAGQPDRAWPLLAEAARRARDRNAMGEAFHLAEGALETAEEAGADDAAELGELHLMCGAFLRTAGRTDWASEHLDEATGLLDGTSRVAALRLAAMVADDGQRPQDAERIVALAELEAQRLGETGRLGSLLAFRARTLSRLGFADEADATLGKSVALLEENASELEQFRAKVNESWIYFDRGEAAKADTGFARLQELARDLEGEASVADKQAWRSRALFAAGRPSEALEAVAEAERLALQEDVEGPLFLAQLALTEGALTFGRYEEALESAERALDLVERQLPAWENMARSLVATALMRLGRLEEAGTEIDRALEATPPGSNGWRWRIRCRAIQMEIATLAGERWPENEAEDLADLMLQSRLYGWAAELLTVIAEHGKRKNAASQALSIATFAGQPMIAARAAHAGSLWTDPETAHTILALHAMAKDIPEEWSADWKALPFVTAALGASQPVDDEAFQTATAAMEEALVRSGLATDDGSVLSPAQRRSSGLVYRQRRSRPLVAVAAALGVIVLAGGTAFGVSQLTTDDTPEVTVPAAAEQPAATTTVTEPPPPGLQDTVIIPPGAVDTQTAADDVLVGTAEHRAGFTRTGALDVQGPRKINGYYWKWQTAGPVEIGPTTYGNYVYVGSTEGTFYALDQTTGRRHWSLTPEGDIRTAPAMGQIDVGEGTPPIVMVVANDDGIVQGHHATSDSLPPTPWMTNVGERVRSAPIVVGDKAVVASTEGFLHGLDLFTGDIVWTYPSEGDGLGTITADLAYADDYLYVGTQEGALHMFDMSSGAPEPACDPYDQGTGSIVIPIVSDGTVFVPTVGNVVWTFDAGTCGDSQAFYNTEDSIELAPAIAGNVMYFVQGRYLYSLDLSTGLPVWENGSVATPSGFQISSPPVVAGDVVYFASEEGVVYAVDAVSGEELWTWSTGHDVRGAVAVGEDAVFVTSGDGFIYAIGLGAIAED